MHVLVNKHEKAWVWDGNEKEPTITPSILVVNGCGWHGYLTKGEFTPV